MTFDMPMIGGGAAVLMLLAVFGLQQNLYSLARIVLAGSMLLLYASAVLYAGLFGPWGYAGAAILLGAGMTRRCRGYLTTLASARWADADDIPHLLDADHGLPVGRLVAARPALMPAIRSLLNPFVAAETACRTFLAALGVVAWRPVVRLPGPHNLLVSPPGGGKSTAIIVQFILALALGSGAAALGADGEPSFFCLDVKGELATICAPILRACGFNVYIVDPQKIVTQNPDTFDPVRGLRPGSPDVIEVSKQIAADVVPHDPREREQHWSESAKSNLAAAIAFVTEFGGGEHRDLQTAIGTILSREYRDKALKMMRKHGGLIGRLADEIGHAQGDELSSILSTLGRHLSAFSTPSAAASMASSSFSPEVLKREKSAAFFVVPPTHLKERGILRMWLGATIRALLRDGLGGRTVHAIIDEAAAVGQMDALDQALAVGRGYGINVHLAFQSMAQMEVCYPEGQSRAVLAQCSQVYFAIQDAVTGEHISKSMGAQTVVVESAGESSGYSSSVQHGGAHPGSRSTSHSDNSNWNYAQQTRPLLHPNEIMTLPRNLAISICPGTPPILSELVPYFEDARLCASKPSLAPRALAVGTVLLALAAWVVSMAP